MSAHLKSHGLSSQWISNYHKTMSDNHHFIDLQRTSNNEIQTMLLRITQLITNPSQFGGPKIEEITELLQQRLYLATVAKIPNVALKLFNFQSLEIRSTM